MANWTPPPDPAEPPQGGYTAPPGTYDPYAGAPQYEDQTSLGATPLVQPGQPTPPPFQQQPQVQPAPQQPFQQAPFQQQPYGQQPYGQQPFGQQYPPVPQGPPSNAGKVLAIGLAFVVVLGGLVGVAFALKSDDKPDPTPPPIAVSSPAAVPTETSQLPDPAASSAPPPVPEPSAEPAKVPTDLLNPTVKTFWNETFVRVGESTGACPSISPPEMVRLLREHPCVGPYRGAAYTNAAKSVVVVVIIMPMSGRSDLDALKASKLYPRLVAPKAGSGLPSLRGKNIPIWAKTLVTKDFLIYGMSYEPHGKKAEAGGVVSKSAGHLATELSNVLLWKS
ncbi:MAG: hypothetical protein ABIS86_04600 [Streptosporangiaceae bacterium]